MDNIEFSYLNGTEDTLMAKRVRQYEEQYVFKLTCHFIHNYICDVVSYFLLMPGSSHIRHVSKLETVVELCLLFSTLNLIQLENAQKSQQVIFAMIFYQNSNAVC